jgi:hypothetical protein
MNGPRTSRLVGAALRCYPGRWRRRHGDEAIEVAVLLIRDGTPAASIAFSYLAGAAREWITPRSGRRLSAMACALAAAIGLLGVSVGLLASAGPARAAAPRQVHAPGHCPSGLPLAAVIPAPGHPPLIIRGAGHVRSC